MKWEIATCPEEGEYFGLPCLCVECTAWAVAEVCSEDPCYGCDGPVIDCDCGTEEDEPEEE